MNGRIVWRDTLAMLRGGRQRSRKRGDTEAGWA